MYMKNKNLYHPRVSFIVPARNESKVIGRCLKAIRSLDYDQSLVEILVVDDHSVDGTVEIARSFGTTILQPPHRTISALRNSGAQNAKGRWLAFVDADCILESDWLRRALKYFNDPRVACVGSYPSVPEDSSWVSKAWDAHRCLYAPSQEVDWLPSRTLLLDRDAFEAVGGFEDSLVTCEDVDLCYRLRQRGYKIISDGRIKSMHLGEPRTLFEFFKKEQWRGRASFRGVLIHGLYPRELPSLLLPVYYWLAFIAALIGAAYGIGRNDYRLLYMTLIFFVFPPAILSLWISHKIGNHSSFLRLALLYLTYSVARSTAVLYGRDHS